MIREVISSNLFRERGSNMLYKPLLASPKTAIIFSRLCQAHMVWTENSLRISILIILSVILPETHFADVVATSLFQCFVVAAWTSITHTLLRRSKHRLVAHVFDCPVNSLLYCMSLFVENCRMFILLFWFRHLFPPQTGVVFLSAYMRIMPFLDL
jgi:hypothetical protein